jgi:hypothetical protein
MLTSSHDGYEPWLRQPWALVSQVLAAAGLLDQPRALMSVAAPRLNPGGSQGVSVPTVELAGRHVSSSSSSSSANE